MHATSSQKRGRGQRWKGRDSSRSTWWKNEAVGEDIEGGRGCWGGKGPLRGSGGAGAVEAVRRVV